ncbi:hypothetical protein Rhe02_42160 [Rhizocola hellebori]|uniref:Exo-alpha-sialidase n=1 Tax=Rhizocola hellebori TaxID=1392758 RepID=A0A8J3Q8T0_9ACTN|nr:hypothetical protein [Rhizocola hellebori]GIH06149.1 hypothetical protein Rhe02_42160 [Rhizocola hellebori]
MLRLLTAALAANVLLAAAGAAATSSTWVSAPLLLSEKEANEAVLRDVGVISPNDVWVVGGLNRGGQHTLAAHWDGSGWTIVPTPDSSDHLTEYAVNALDAVASDDVWAVGGIQDQANPAKVSPLFLHYDGVEWTDGPEPIGVHGELTDIDMLSADDGWVVGVNEDKPLIMRRTAGAWELVPTPDIEGAISLESVFATSADDAWAVGFNQLATKRIALVLHWDGVRWSEVTVAGLPTGETGLVGVAAASATEVWAVGSQCSGQLCRPMVLHLAGATWRTEPTAPGAELTSVVAFAPNDVWIFGQVAAQLAVSDHIEHWDGSGFTIDTTVPPVIVDPHHSASALSLAAASGDPLTRTMWAVGWVQGTQKNTHAIYRN